MAKLREFFDEVMVEVDKITTEEVDNYELTEPFPDEQVLCKIDDDELKKLIVLIDKKTCSVQDKVRELKTKMEATDSKKEESDIEGQIDKEREIIPVIEGMKNIFWFSIRKKYDVHHERLGIRKDWVLIIPREKSPGQMLMDLIFPDIK